MPFVQRTVEPRFPARLSAARISSDVRQHDDLDSVANGTLVSVVRQLASIASLADEIFHGLADDLRQVTDRSEGLRRRIGRIDDVVAQFDAKAVTVPVGDLKAYGRVKQHYVKHSPIDKNLFTVDGRPETIRRLYKVAVASPVHVIRQIDCYRSDGRRASRVFLCLPFFKDAKVTFDLEIEMRRPASLCTARDWLSDDEGNMGYGTCDDEPKVLILDRTLEQNRNCLVVPTTDGVKPGDDTNDVLRKLPSPEEKTYVMSLKFPYSDVPIDVTGSGFRRMASLRRSFLQHVDYLTKGSQSKRHKKSKRRSTISGTTASVDQALDEANKRRHLKRISSSCGTQTSPERSFSDCGPSTAHNGSVTESRMRTTAVGFRDDVIVHLARSSESCGKDTSKTTSLRKKLKNKLLLDGHNSNLEKERSSSASSTSSSSSSLPGLKWFQRKSRSRNSIIGSLGIDEELERVKKSRTKGFFGRPSLVLEAESPSKTHADSAVDVVNHRKVRSASIRASHRSSLPVWISASSRESANGTVKLRENCKKGRGGGVEDGGGQSSSGNWSASSSTRTSVGSAEGDRAIDSIVPRPRSQASLSKDSALSDRATPCLNDDQFRWTDVGCHNGYNSDISAGTSSSNNNRKSMFRRSVAKDTARWLRSLEEERAAVGFKVVGETNSLGTITPRSHRRRTRLNQSPIDVHSGPPFVDDGESSEFSVDTDGYYTSMHTDSGLRPLVTSSRKADDGSTLSKLSDLQECGSSTTIGSMASSEEGSSSIKRKTSDGDTPNHVVSNSITEHLGGEAVRPKKRVPPPPPPRTSTLSTPKPLSINVDMKIPRALVFREESPVDSSSISSSSDNAQLRLRKHSTSSSESELGRSNSLKLKTSIDINRIPSMCVVTPSPSDEDEEGSPNPRSTLISPLTTFAKPLSANRGPYASSSDTADSLVSISTTPMPLHSARTLPRALDRSASFNSHVSCQQRTWPRTSVFNQVVYRPETIALTSCRDVPLKEVENHPSVLASFSHAPEAIRRPSSIAVPDSSMCNRPMSPPVIVSPTGSYTNGQHQGGARVTLDSSGRVIYSTAGSSTRKLVQPSCNSVQGCVPMATPTSPVLPIASTPVPVASFTGNDSYNGIRSSESAKLQDPYSPPSAAPRRWNSFFQRREPPQQASASSPGAYIRLDGHPEHLEPAGAQPTLNNPPKPIVKAPVILASTPNMSKASELFPPYWRRQPIQPKDRVSVSSTPIPPVTVSPPNSSPLPRYYTPIARPDLGAQKYVRPCTVLPNRGPMIPVYSVQKPQQMLNATAVSYGPSQPKRLETSSQIIAPSKLTNELKTAVADSNNNSFSANLTVSPSKVSPVGMARVTQFQQQQQQQQKFPEKQIPVQQQGLRARTPTGDPNCSGLPVLHSNTRPPYTASPRNALPSPSNRVSPAMQDNSLMAEVTQSPTKPLLNAMVTRSAPQSPNKTPTKSTMSNEDLYALIHRSKKRLNIRTDAERAISPPCLLNSGSSAGTGSPSSSPSISVPLKLDPSSSNTVTKTTGEWTPSVDLSTARSRSPLCYSGDRRSWAGVGRTLATPSPTPSSVLSSLSCASPGDRHSWASDRLGPAKHTSLHDFKLLLLQAGRSIPKELVNTRPSATELLMSPPPSPIKIAVPRTPSPLSGGVMDNHNFYQQRTRFGGLSGPKKQLHAGPLRHGHHRNLMAAMRGCSSPSASALLHNRSDVLSSPILEAEDEGPILATHGGRVEHSEVVVAVV